MSNQIPQVYISKPDPDVYKQVLNIINYDVKKLVAIGHGYVPLVWLDIEEDILTADNLDEYIKELDDNYQRIEKYLELTRDLFRSKFEE